MDDFEEGNGEEVIGIGYRDVLMNMLGVVTTMLVALLVMVTVEKVKESDGTSTPPGNVIAHLLYPEGNTDIDLWVDGPGELVPVGYSNKGGLLWNLLRDDLGTQPDATGINYEDAFTRGVVPGEYTVNAHCYRCPVLPQLVHVEVSINTGDPGEKTPLKVLVTTSINLTQEGQERTAIRFYLNEDGTIKPGSMNSVFKPLRSAKK